ncbi:hypothetical protein C6361_02015 [Plantactinospora sp. BC1]|nr:hypothetical protein C6361_02015 [Plantactinospora sp. BC1]
MKGRTAAGSGTATAGRKATTGRKATPAGKATPARKAPATAVTTTAKRANGRAAKSAPDTATTRTTGRRRAPSPATAATPTASRSYRRAPDDLAQVFNQAGTVTAVADHYGVPRHTAQSWVRTWRQNQERASA